MRCPDPRVFNVRNYGAFGDEGDDTRPIERAVEAANKAGGGTIWFPPGKYAGVLNLLRLRGRILFTGRKP